MQTRLTLQHLTEAIREFVLGQRANGLEIAHMVNDGREFFDVKREWEQWCTANFAYSRIHAHRLKRVSNLVRRLTAQGSRHVPPMLHAGVEKLDILARLSDAQLDKFLNENDLLSTTKTILAKKVRAIAYVNSPKPDEFVPTSDLPTREELSSGLDNAENLNEIDAEGEWDVADTCLLRLSLVIDTLAPKDRFGIVAQLDNFKNRIAAAK